MAGVHYEAKPVQRCSCCSWVSMQVVQVPGARCQCKAHSGSHVLKAWPQPTRWLCLAAAGTASCTTVCQVASTPVDRTDHVTSSISRRQAALGLCAPWMLPLAATAASLEAAQAVAAQIQNDFEQGYMQCSSPHALAATERVCMLQAVLHHGKANTAAV